MAFKDALQAAGIEESGVLDWRDAKYWSSGDESVSKYPGYAILTKDRLLFVCEKGLLRGIKKMFDIEISKIKSIKKYPLVGALYISGNTADEGAGFLKKIVSMKGAQIEINDWKPFVEKIRGINPNIKT